MALNFTYSVLFLYNEIALPEFLYEEYWTYPQRFRHAGAAILGGSIGILLAEKYKPFGFIFRWLDKYLDKKERTKEKDQFNNKF